VDELPETVGLAEQAEQRLVSLSGGQRRRLDVAVGPGRPARAAVPGRGDGLLILAEGRIVADGSADQLARQVAGQAEVRWSRGGERFVHATPDATRFVRELFAQYGDEMADLEVRRASLEDTYMIMVHRHEHPHLQEVVA
jgi:ABC-2 type transport system ATP-binding protein